MAEPLKDKKPNLKQLLEDLEEENDFTDEEREKSLEQEYKEWSSRLTKSKA